MPCFSSVSEVFLSRQLLKLANQHQWEQAKKSRNPEDYEAAKQGSKALSIMDTLSGLARLGRY